MKIDKRILRFYEFVDNGNLDNIDYSAIINEGLLQDFINYIKGIGQKIKNLLPGQKYKVPISNLVSLFKFHKQEEIQKKLETETSSSIDFRKKLKEIADLFRFQDPTIMIISQNGINKIKNEEGDPKRPGEPVLKPYKLGDNRITVGWGHAELINKSKLKVGKAITKDQAQKYLQDDLKVAQDGVRKIFTEWKAQKIYRYLTQDQFDALVSMAFNIGVSNLRQSQVIKKVKEGKYEEAGELIKKQNLNTNFPGLVKRRNKESQLFLSYVDKIKKYETQVGGIVYF